MVVLEVRGKPIVYDRPTIEAASSILVRPLRVVVDNDGLHGTLERSGNVALAGGLHRIVVEWFNKTGGAELDVMFAPVGSRPGKISGPALKHRY